MTEGTSSYDGLAVPLSGESEITQQDITKDILTLTSGASNTAGDFIVCQDSSGTEPFVVEDDGRTRINRRGTFSEALNAYYYCTTTNSSQEFGARFMLDEELTTVAGGRRAVLSLRFNGSQAGNHAGRSFLTFEDQGELGTALFAVLGGAVDGGSCYESLTNPNSTKGLVIYANNEKLWLLCSSAST